MFDNRIPLLELWQKRRSSSSKKPAAKRRKTQDTVKNKALSTVQQLDRAMKAHRWWEAAAMPKGQRWHSLEHHGINFQPPYQPHGVKMLYDGQPVDLTPVQEEIATHYAKVPPDGPQLGKPAVAKIFNKNFFACFRKALGRNHVIKKFEKCDFSPIRNMVLHKREVRKARTSEEKAEEKAEKLSTSLKYGYALVDGHVQKVGNFTIEPPGLFLGRGVHPKTGTVKTRTAPEEVTVNVGMDEAVPRCLVPGGAWGTVVSDNSVTWLGFWHENVMNGTKYVWLAASSGFKGQSDLAKYEKARKLKQYIGKIRADYQKNLRRKRIATKQLATAMWIIDILALRVGNEKDDDEADTVGCCSLRVEHLKFHEDTEGNEAGPFTLTLDFLGKDSMRHLQSIDFGEERFGEVGRKVFENLKSFCAKKKPSADVFDQLTVCFT